MNGLAVASGDEVGESDSNSRKSSQIGLEFQRVQIVGNANERRRRGARAVANSKSAPPDDDRSSRGN